MSGAVAHHIHSLAVGNRVQVAVDERLVFNERLSPASADESPVEAAERVLAQHGWHITGPWQPDSSSVSIAPVQQIAT